jgi:hypothetical protein
MAAIVAPGVCRYAVHGTFGGQDIVNIFDIKIDTTGSTISRTDAINAQAGIVINQWTSDICTQISNNYTFTSVSWVDLDTDAGETGERSSTGTITLPQTGSSTQTPLPGSVCLLAHKLAGKARNTRNGRLYLCGITENMTVAGAPNNIAAANLAGFQTQFTALKGNIEQEGGGVGDYSSKIVVVHTSTKGPGTEKVLPYYTGQTPISGFKVDGLLATQRRRLRD